MTWDNFLSKKMILQAAWYRPPYVGVNIKLIANVPNYTSALKQWVVGKSGKLSTKKGGFQQFLSSYPHLKFRVILQVGYIWHKF